MALEFFPNVARSTKTADGTTYAFARFPAADSKPTFLLLHGFPGMAYDWRDVIPKLTAGGYGAIVPDLLGYGDTDKPTDVASYSFARMAGHIKEILQQEGLAKVIGVGHDWGVGMLSWVAFLHGELFAGLAFLALSYIPPRDRDLGAFNAMSVKMFGYACFGYQEWFITPECAPVLDAHPESTVSCFYPVTPEDWETTACPPGAAEKFISSDTRTTLPAWLSQDYADAHIKTFSKNGYTGPLNWYKSGSSNQDRPHYQGLSEDDLKIHTRAVVVPARRDKACRPEMAEMMAPKFLTNYRIVSLDCGHWIPHEKPKETAEILLELASELPSKL